MEELRKKERQEEEAERVWLSWRRKARLMYK